MSLSLLSGLCWGISPFVPSLIRAPAEGGRVRILNRKRCRHAPAVGRSAVHLPGRRHPAARAPKGLGHAISCARPAVGNEPFAVVLPDVLIDDYESDHGEIQLTDTIGMLLESAPVEALV